MSDGEKVRRMQFLAFQRHISLRLTEPRPLEVVRSRHHEISTGKSAWRKRFCDSVPTSSCRWQAVNASTHTQTDCNVAYGSCTTFDDRPGKSTRSPAWNGSPDLRFLERRGAPGHKSCSEKRGCSEYMQGLISAMPGSRSIPQQREVVHDGLKIDSLTGVGHPEAKGARK